MPQFFVALSSVLVAAKAIIIVLVSKDTRETYIKGKQTRLRRATWVIAPIFALLFIIMNFRFTRTCYRHITVPWQTFIEIRTLYHFSILFGVKALCVAVLIICFCLLFKNQYFGGGTCCIQGLRKPPSRASMVKASMLSDEPARKCTPTKI